MSKIGILGGTFDPPHFGHLLIANEVLHALTLDEIWFMPNNKPPHKDFQMGTESTHRVEMLARAIAGEPKFRIESMELKREGPSYTYDTIKLLSERETNAEFYFIIGADMVEYLPNWYKIDELLKMVTFVGVERPSFDLSTQYPILFVEVPEFAVSSSLVRNRLQHEETTKYLLPDSVIQYIKEHHLYGT